MFHFSKLVSHYQRSSSWFNRRSLKKAVYVINHSRRNMSFQRINIRSCLCITIQTIFPSFLLELHDPFPRVSFFPFSFRVICVIKFRIPSSVRSFLSLFTKRSLLFHWFFFISSSSSLLQIISNWVDGYHVQVYNRTAGGHDFKSRDVSFITSTLTRTALYFSVLLHDEKIEFEVWKILLILVWNYVST